MRARTFIFPINVAMQGLVFYGTVFFFQNGTILGYIKCRKRFFIRVFAGENGKKFNYIVYSVCFTTFAQ